MAASATKKVVDVLSRYRDDCHQTAVSSQYSREVPSGVGLPRLRYSEPLALNRIGAERIPDNEEAICQLDAAPPVQESSERA